MSEMVFSGEQETYLQLREKLLTAERELKAQIEHVATLRRQLPPGRSMPDYVFREGPTDLSQNNVEDMVERHFSELFSAGKDTLIMDHFMFSSEDKLLFGAQSYDEPCVMCSMWADGYNAIAPHIQQRVNFVLVAQAEITRLRSFAARRNWHHLRLLSCRDNTFYRDMGIIQDVHEVARPGLSVFTRSSDGQIIHRYTTCGSEERDIDLYTPVWHLFDLLPQGRGDWYPAHNYIEHQTPCPSCEK